MIALSSPRTHEPRSSSLRARAIAAVCARIDRLSRGSVTAELDALVNRASAAEASASDAPLVALGLALGLTELELLSIALAAAVEHDMLLGRALERLQEPLGSARPTLGLLASLFCEPNGPDLDAVASLLCGAAVASGLLMIVPEALPIAERTVSVPLPVYLALEGRDGAAFAGTSIDLSERARVPLPDSTLSEIARQAKAFGASEERALSIRCVSSSEARTVAYTFARALGKRVVFVEGEPSAGFGVWARMRGLIPAIALELAPGERKSIRAPLGYAGPLLTVSGCDGTIELAGASIPSFTPLLPEASERARLWRESIGDRPFIDALARDHRHRAGRIAQVGRLAQHLAVMRGAPNVEQSDVERAACAPEGAGHGALAESVTDVVGDDALVVRDALRAELERLVLRCRARDGLAAHLGPAARARYRTGVRALFVGPSGTGKTLAASWLATRLGIPMVRVDLASVTSKYIGETEKNLAAMFARAEESEVIILFDEADALFASRTDVRDSNDRFANAQTNYLLQRIETFDGIALLTSNSRQRIDQAFSRRLDAILEFHLPDAEERRRLWEAHLGPQHALPIVEVNRLAALVDLAGGQIRNAVLCAAAIAYAEERPMTYADIAVGLAGEYRKLGKQMPRELGLPWEGG